MSEDGNGVPAWVKRDFERFDRELQEVRRTHRQDINDLKNEIREIRTIIQGTRDELYEQRGKLVLLVMLASALTATAITIVLNRVG